MKRILGLGLLVAVVGAAVWLVWRGAEARAVRRVVNDLQAAALEGLNRRDPSVLDVYFVTVEEGAVAAGLAETREAFKDFVAGLPWNNAVQFHSFDIQAIEVHEDAGLAKVTYRVHFSVLRGGQVAFSAGATQDLALRRTPRGWRIMGGDAPQLEDVSGSWPPR